MASVAALYDIHGNLAALEAVLAEVPDDATIVVGGDIAAGAMSAWQTVCRPVPAWDPYVLPADGLYLCSASVPPGPGVHGMAGVHVASRVLRRQFGITCDPLELVRQD